MASITSSRLAVRSLLSLPPHLRTTTYTNARSFSASSRKNDLVSMAVAGPTFLLDALHTTFGLPWYTTLPLTAVLVRTTLVYYIAIRPGRKRRQIQNHLSPLAHAHVILDWNSREERKRRSKEASGGVPPALRSFDAYATRIMAFWRNMNKLSKSFGLGGWRPWWLLNFGLLITFSEAIRLKCGSREGLLKTMISPFEWLQSKLDLSIGAAGSVPPTPTTVTTPAAQVPHTASSPTPVSDHQAWDSITTHFPNEASNTVATSFPDSPSNTFLPTALSDDMTAPFFDPTMQTEGLLWCTDLTIPDPTFILPAMLFGTMCTTMLLRPTMTGAAKTPKQTPKQTPEPDPLAAPDKQNSPSLAMGTRVGLTIALLFTFAATEMPAGILLYIVANVASGWAQQRYLDWKDPIRPPIRPCRRPVRMKVVRVW